MRTLLEILLWLRSLAYLLFLLAVGYVLMGGFIKAIQHFRSN